MKRNKREMRDNIIEISVCLDEIVMEVIMNVSVVYSCSNQTATDVKTMPRSHRKGHVVTIEKNIESSRRNWRRDLIHHFIQTNVQN